MIFQRVGKFITLVVVGCFILQGQSFAGIDDIPTAPPPSPEVTERVIPKAPPPPPPMPKASKISDKAVSFTPSAPPPPPLPKGSLFSPGSIDMQEKRNSLRSSEYAPTSKAVVTLSPKDKLLAEIQKGRTLRPANLRSLKSTLKANEQMVQQMANRAVNEAVLTVFAPNAHGGRAAEEAKSFLRTFLRSVLGVVGIQKTRNDFLALRGQKLITISGVSVKDLVVQSLRNDMDLQKAQALEDGNLFLWKGRVKETAQFKPVNDTGGTDPMNKMIRIAKERLKKQFVESKHAREFWTYVFSQGKETSPALVEMRRMSETQKAEWIQKRLGVMCPEDQKAYHDAMNANIPDPLTKRVRNEQTQASLKNLTDREREECRKWLEARSEKECWDTFTKDEKKKYFEERYHFVLNKQIDAHAAVLKDVPGAAATMNEKVLARGESWGFDTLSSKSPAHSNLDKLFWMKNYELWRNARQKDAVESGAEKDSGFPSFCSMTLAERAKQKIVNRERLGKVTAEKNEVSLIVPPDYRDQFIKGETSKEDIVFMGSDLTALMGKGVQDRVDATGYAHDLRREMRRQSETIYAAKHTIKKAVSAGVGAVTSTVAGLFGRSSK